MENSRDEVSDTCNQLERCTNEKRIPPVPISAQVTGVSDMRSPNCMAKGSKGSSRMEMIGSSLLWMVRALDWEMLAQMHYGAFGVRS